MNELLNGPEIVSQLHEDAATVRSALDYGDQDWVSQRFIQAADEIERLRTNPTSGLFLTNHELWCVLRALDDFVEDMRETAEDYAQQGLGAEADACKLDADVAVTLRQRIEESECS